MLASTVINPFRHNLLILIMFASRSVRFLYPPSKDGVYIHFVRMFATCRRKLHRLISACPSVHLAE